MATFMNTTQALGEVENILTTAKNQIVLISPFVKVNEELIARLFDAGNRRKLKIYLVCRESALKTEEKARLQKIDNLELLFNEKIHAKCFFNESKMVITSLNLYDSLSGDNHEMGVLLDSIEDSKAFNPARDEAQYIIRESMKIGKKEAAPAITTRSKSETMGHCIRCNVEIPLDTEKPYCLSCFKHAKYDIDEEFAPVENFCLYCGRDTESSIDKPLCYDCYKKFSKRKAK